MHTSARRPIWLGVVAAALAAPTAFFIYSAISALGQAKFDLTGLLVAGLAIYYFGVLVSGPVAFAIGWPYTLWLKKHGRLTWPTVCTAAMLLGLLTFSAIWFLSFQTYQPLLAFAVLGAFSGLLSGIAFCTVVRPNNSFKPSPHQGSA